MLKDNLKEVEANIMTACEKAGRNREDVTLIAVSKTKPVSMLEEIYAEGIRTFGENKVQELTEKYGHLQRNKVKYIVGKVSLIHSVDSYRLAEEINIQAKKHQVTVPILIEVNVAGEDTKFGVRPEETLRLVEEIASLENVRIQGLMTIAPFVEDPEENRVHFRRLKQLSVDIDSKNIDNVHMEILSMGMTNDYMVAIEEGATMVRVGTGIFGARNYANAN